MLQGFIVIHIFFVKFIMTRFVRLLVAELLESAMYLYRATKDPFLLDIGIDTVEAIEHSARTECGYATVSHSEKPGVHTIICYI